jgi:hypothetical protein
MAYTEICRDAGDYCYQRNSLPRSEATPQPYSPEYEHAIAPPPPRCVSVVSILRSFAFDLSVMVFFSRPHLPHTVPAIPLNGIRPRRTRVPKTSVMACRCHIPTIWLVTIMFGLTRSGVFRTLLGRRRRRRVLPSHERSRRIK